MHAKVVIVGWSVTAIFALACSANDGSVTPLAPDAGLEGDAPPGSDASMTDLGDGGMPSPEAGRNEGGASGGAALWSVFAGDGAYEDVGGIAVDASGNVFMSGYFQGTVDFGGGPMTATGQSSDAFVVKFDPSGKFLWNVRYGDGQVQVAYGIAADAQGNVIVTGFNMGTMDVGLAQPLVTAGKEDIFVLKLDGAGKALWAKGYGDTDTQSGTGVAVDPQGNIVITGSMKSTTDFGKGVLTSAGMDDMYLAGLNPSGVTQWAARYGDATEQFGISAAFDTSGALFFTGDFDGTVDFGLGPLVSAGGYDAALVKLDGTGKALFAKRFGDANNQVGDQVAVDGQGDVAFSGGFEGTIDLGKGALTAMPLGSKFLAKLDPSLNVQWAKGLGEGNVFDPTTVAVDEAGDIVVAGEFKNVIDFGLGPIAAKDGYDIFVAKYGSDGAPRWGERFGAINDQFARSVAVPPSGNIVMGGYFLGKLGFNNGGGQTAPGNGLLYAVELSP